MHCVLRCSTKLLLFLLSVGTLVGLNRTIRLQKLVWKEVVVSNRDSASYQPPRDIQQNEFENQSIYPSRNRKDTGLRFDRIRNKSSKTPVADTNAVLSLTRAPKNNNNTSKTAVAHNKTTAVLSPTRLPVRKWAYAFLIGGCSSRNPGYRGFLYNVIVAAQQLRELGTKADVVLFVQLSATTNETDLPHDEIRVLDALNVRTIYIPKYEDVVHEVFYTLNLEKFRILNATDYSRVLFLDSDVMPLCSLDYLFELSEPKEGKPLLKENVLVSTVCQPGSGGIFMLQPKREDYLELQRIIRSHEERALKLPWPHWDPEEGWGHRITPPDFWRCQKQKGTNWTWHEAFADQGLLFHWTKYVKQSVSIIIGDELENWTSKNGTAYLEEILKRVLDRTARHVPPSLFGQAVNSTGKSTSWIQSRSKTSSALGDLTEKCSRGPSPYGHIVHFTGKKKPWLQNSSKTIGPRMKQITEQWFRILTVVGTQTNTSFNFEKDSSPPVGMHSSFLTKIEHIRAKESKNWTQYAK